MPQNLFTTVKKIPFYLDDISHSLEKRKQGDTKIITLTMTLSPLDAKLASVFDDGQVLRRTLFKLNQPEPQPHFKSVIFRIPFPRQRMEIFTTIDTAKASILIDQVRVESIKVRVEKKSNLFSLILKLSFGPASRTELEFIEKWRTQTKAVTFDEAEQSLDFEDPDSDSEGDEEAEAAGGRPAPMFDDVRDDKPADEQRAIEAAAAAPGEPETPDKARQLPRRNSTTKPGPRRIH